MDIIYRWWFVPGYALLDRLRTVLYVNRFVGQTDKLGAYIYMLTGLTCTENKQYGSIKSHH